MKKLFVFVLIFPLVYGKLYSQCTISNVALELVSYNTSTCQAVFNLSWQQETNNGNKFAYIHLWKVADYHTPAANWTNMYANPNDAPKAADLVNSVGTIAIFNNGTATPTIGTSYPPDATVTPLSSGVTVTKTHFSGTGERMTVKNISINLAGCGPLAPLEADVWASQAANGKTVHCVSQGLTFDIHNPTVVALKVCAPRSISFGITNNGTTPLSLHYVLYKDNGDALFNPDGPGFDSVLTTGPQTTVAAGATYSQFQYVYPGATTNLPNISLWVEAVVTGASATTVAYAQDPSCATLPVALKSFAAKRNHSVVELKWTTSTEINNSGFEVQRQVGVGSWQAVAFVPTQANGGNSSSDLNYVYNDQNNARGLSNYRIRQVDLDNKSRFSDVRAVRGEGQAAKTIVYPNPSFDGKVNVVFDDDNAIRTVTLMDMNGRTMKQWRNVANNNIQIDNLAPGFYSLRIVNAGTNEQTIEKFVVNKR